MTFIDGENYFGPVALSGGKATYTTSSLPVGAHSIVAFYGGATAYQQSYSKVDTQTVNKAATTTALASSANPSVKGQAVTFTATVTAVAPGKGTPTGTVTFKDGATVLGTAAVSGGKASLATSSLAVGSHSMSATYNGSTSFLTGTSPVLTQTVS